MIGVGPSKRFDFSELPAAHQRAIGGGVKSAVARIKEEAKTSAVAGDDRAGYDGNWLRRAAATYLGWGVNNAEEASYPVYRTDADGDHLNASKHRYTLRFEEGGLAPVKAFWSVTMYDAETQLLTENPIDRYLINSSMLPDLKKNSDGSLTLHVQKDSPGTDREANWLPAPDDKFYMLLRLYWPSEAILDGTWKKPEVQKSL